jgi:hypothetical protein
VGNRAVITFAPYSEASVGVYLHWNGGPSSVLGILDACGRLEFRGPSQDPAYAMARLIDAVTALIPGSLSVGVGLNSQLDTDNGDNGTYVIDGITGNPWSIVERKFNRGIDSLDAAHIEAVSDAIVLALGEAS